MLRRFTLQQTTRAASVAASSAAHCRRAVAIPTQSNTDTVQSRHPERMSAFDLNSTSMVNKVKVAPQTWKNPIEHPVWDLKEAENIKITHKKCNGFVDSAAYGTVQLLRWCFDLLAGFKFGKITEHKYINRCVFLETVAGVPGMVAGMLRHLTSLRRMRRDHGWIHTLLEEAENERMHLLTFIEIRKPGMLMRSAIVITQFGFFTAFALAYLVCPRFCHRLVGYVEEEAVKTYTKILADMDDGKLPKFVEAKCPPLAISYWRLPEDATFRDLISVIRADEAGHRLVNHTFADMHERRLQDDTNPFVLYDTHGDRAPSSA